MKWATRSIASQKHRRLLCTCQRALEDHIVDGRLEERFDKIRTRDVLLCCIVQRSDGCLPTRNNRPIRRCGAAMQHPSKHKQRLSSVFLRHLRFLIVILERSLLPLSKRYHIRTILTPQPLVKRWLTKLNQPSTLWFTSSPTPCRTPNTYVPQKHPHTSPSASTVYLEVVW